ncbi:hypothetical protein ACA910_021028 [Epithemia clementina (nom. ined.)]
MIELSLLHHHTKKGREATLWQNHCSRGQRRIYYCALSAAASEDGPQEELLQDGLVNLTSRGAIDVNGTRDFLIVKKEDDNDEKNATEINRLDQVLSRCTSAFPLYVVAFSILGLTFPSSLKWINNGNLVTYLLAAVMCGTGLTLLPQDFAAVFQQSGWSSVPLGVACQFLIMPLTAFVVGKSLLLTLPATTVAPTVASNLFLGLCLVGCSPGGTASNLVTLIAKANVALSVVLTACSTLLAVVATPFLVQLLVQSQVSVSARDLYLPTARVILFPVLVGMILNAKAPKLSKWLSRFTPLASAVTVGIICGGVVAQSSHLLRASTTTVAASNSSMLLLFGPVVSSVLLLHAIGFALGYAVPRWFFGKSTVTSRTMSIEVGMQNSVLAVVLARSIGAPAIAQLPGALSATAHSCLGSMLAARWRNNNDNTDSEEGAGKSGL